MIDNEDNSNQNWFLYRTMEQCSRQCIRRTLYAVMIGVSPIVLCLVFIGLARLILYRLEIAYYRRQKSTDRRSSLISSQSGRLALSYTPVSHAELQRIIRGEYQTRQINDSSTTNSNIRRAPKFIKSILPRREQAHPSTSILANLVIRRDAIDANAIADITAPIDIPLQPTFSVINEQSKRRPSLITIKRESIETTTLTPKTAKLIKNINPMPKTDDINESEAISNDDVMTASKTMTTTTTIVVEEFLDYDSVSSIPCALTVLNTVAESEPDNNSETSNEQEEEE